MRRMRNSKLCPILSAQLQTQTNEPLPVIIEVKDKDEQTLSTLCFSMSDKIRRSLPLVGGVACNMSLNEINRLARDPNIEYISFDSKVFALLDIANASIGSSLPHDIGYEGEGITVAVIDTGVAPHNDLVRPKNRIVGFKDFVNEKTNPYDDNGHGTHVAGIIASNGFSSNGKYAGIAPLANILAVKALDDSGSGNTSDIVSAIEWVIETRNQYNTKIINLSLGSPANNPIDTDPLARAVDEAVKAGLTVIVAAGNSGPESKTILSPGNSPSVITVGAVDDKRTPEVEDDTIASFSSRGPTKEGLRKPDLVAPGVEIMSLSSSNLGDYITSSGTSMATPVIAGCAALLMNKYGDISPTDVKNKFAECCRDLNDKYENQGAGVINLNKLFEDDADKVPRKGRHKTPRKAPPKAPINQPPKMVPREGKAVNSNIFGESIIILLLVILLLFIDFE